MRIPIRFRLPGLPVLSLLLASCISDAPDRPGAEGTGTETIGYVFQGRVNSRIAFPGPVRLGLVQAPMKGTLKVTLQTALAPVRFEAGDPLRFSARLDSLMPRNFRATVKAPSGREYPIAVAIPILTASTAEGRDSLLAFSTTHLLVEVPDSAFLLEREAYAESRHRPVDEWRGLKPGANWVRVRMPETDGGFYSVTRMKEGEVVDFRSDNILALFGMAVGDNLFFFQREEDSVETETRGRFLIGRETDTVEVSAPGTLQDFFVQAVRGVSCFDGKGAAPCASKPAFWELEMTLKQTFKVQSYVGDLSEDERYSCLENWRARLRDPGFAAVWADSTAGEAGAERYFIRGKGLRPEKAVIPPPDCDVRVERKHLSLAFFYSESLAKVIKPPVTAP